MAIKRIKRDTIHELVAIQDGAIDKDKSNIKEYKSTLDLSLLAYKKGEKPSLFMVKGVGYLRKEEIEKGHIVIELPNEDSPKGTKPKVEFVNRQELMLKYFKECVVGVKEWNGKAYVEEKISEDDVPNGVIEDLGDQCMMLAMLGEPLKKT